MSKCYFCDGTGKYRRPKDEERFEKLVDREMEKGYFVNIAMAQEKAYKEVGYDIIDCPHCQVCATEEDAQ